MDKDCECGMMKVENVNNGYITVEMLAESLGLEERHITYYERRGLVSPLISKQNGRLFSNCDKARLRLITRAKDAGYSVGKIESLIGKISPHLSETAKARESVDIASKNFEMMHNDQAESDVLEQINIACDLELLGDYIRELNALGYEPHPPKKQQQRVREKVQRPPENGAYSAGEYPVDLIPSIVDVIGKKPTGISKKYVLVPIFFGLVAVIGFGLFFNRPERVPESMFNRQIDNPSPAANASAVDSGRTKGDLSEDTQEDELDLQQTIEGEAPALSMSLMSESPESLHQEDEIDSGEGVMTDQPSGRHPSPMVLKDENPLEPLGTEPRAIGSEAEKSELINRLISDMQSKYDSPPPPAKAPKKDLYQTHRENDELKAVAEVTAALSLVQKAKKNDPSNTVSSSNRQIINPDKTANEASESLSSTKPSLAEKPTQKKEPSKTAAPKTTNETPARKARPQEVEKETAKDSASKPSAMQLAAVPVAPKAESAKPIKPSSTLNEKAPAPSAAKQKVQPRQVLKDKPIQPQPSRQKVSPVKKPAPEKSKTDTQPAPEKQLENIDPAALDWARKSRESFQKGDMSETIVSATVSISIEPGQVQPYIDRALAYKQKGLFEKAIADCKRAMINDPGSAIAFYTRGVVYQAMGQKQNARLDYAKACVMGFGDACNIQTAQLEQESVDMLMKQSRESFRQRDWDAVILATTRVLQQDPANVIAYVTRSAAYSQKRMFTDAISDCDAALKIDPGYALAYNNRGYAWEQLEKNETAIADYKQACSLGLKLGCKNYEKF
jgi:tetratricopeptide (TPR) repeat protein/DNA-binding transcriptional MerR regulator